MITGIRVRLPVLLRRHLRLLFQTKVVGLSYFSGALQPASATLRLCFPYFDAKAFLPLTRISSSFDGQGAVKSAYTCTTATGGIGRKQKGGHGHKCLPGLHFI